MSKTTEITTPFKLQEAGPTDRAKRAATAVIGNWALYHHRASEYETIVEIIDREAGIKELIGSHNEMVQRYEDEHELRLRLKVDLRLMQEKCDDLRDLNHLAADKIEQLAGERDELLKVLNDLRVRLAEIGGLLS